MSQQDRILQNPERHVVPHISFEERFHKLAISNPQLPGPFPESFSRAGQHHDSFRRSDLRAQDCYKPHDANDDKHPSPPCSGACALISGLSAGSIERSALGHNIPPLDLGTPFLAPENLGIRGERKGGLASTAKEQSEESTQAIRNALETLTATRKPDRHAYVAPANSSQSSSICFQDVKGNPRHSKLRYGSELFDASAQTLRRVKFLKRTGNGHYCDFSDASGEEEASRSVPVVYARIIDVQGRRPQVGSHLPKSSLAPKGPAVEKPKATAPSTWEDAVAEANRRFEVAHCENSGVAETDIRRRAVLGELHLSSPLTANTRPMKRLNGDDLHLKIAPIPLDFFGVREFRTPSIHSSRSEFDCSSPLFGKSIEVAVEQSHHKPPGHNLDAASLKELGARKFPSECRVEEWLRHVVSRQEAPDMGDKPNIRSPLGRKDFNVWTDEGRLERKFKGRGVIFKPEEAKRLGRAIKGRGVIFEPEDVAKFCDHSSIDEIAMSSVGDKPSTAQALKDVTNLRQPGYLKHNSFFRDLRKPSHDASLPGPRVVQEPPSPLQSMATPDSQASIVFSPSKSQAAAFNAALARLEGRTKKSWETIFDPATPKSFHERAGTN